MNILSKCLVVCGMCLLISCQYFSTTETHPFKAEYTGVYTSISEDKDKCGEYPEMRVIVDGKGSGTHVGNSKMHFDFCCNIETGTYGYGKTYAYLVASNGDTLLLTASGRVIEGKANNHPEYVTSYWRDSLEIIGGTGRFEGATGGGRTDDYNSSADSNSHHRWSGIITLRK